jgi:O-succinylbenzoate synthase
MRIDRIDLRVVELPLVAPFETSFGRTTSRRIILSRVESAGVVGWGECTAGEGPFYNEEFTEGALAVLERFIVPRLQGTEVESASSVASLLRPIRGNRMAKACVETAVWDLEAKQSGVPLYQMLGGVRDRIECGVSIGLQPTVEDLLDRVGRELEAGYRRIKIKIAPGRDVALVEAVRARFGDIVLSVDANAAYTLDDQAVMSRLDEFGLLMIEQPLAPGDLLDHARWQRELATPICLDESIVDADTAYKAIELGACRIVNIKLGRVGGHSEARRVADVCQRAGVPAWCGGMLESGIGRLHNAAMSTLAGFTLPGDVSDSRRYWARDVVIPRPTVEADGTMLLAAGVGIGAEVDEEFIESIAVA